MSPINLSCVNYDHIKDYNVIMGDVFCIEGGRTPESSPWVEPRDPGQTLATYPGITYCTV